MTTKKTSAIGDNPDSGADKEEKRSRIAELAYSYAEERDFKEGDPNEDWLRAERSIEQMLAGGQ
jgi:hypothetical protein